MAAKTKKILIIVTNHGELGNTGTKTGWYLPEVAHPYEVFTKANYAITFVSPNGGHSPMDPGSGEAFKDDKTCKEFLGNAKAKESMQNTLPPSKVNASDFSAIFFAGGHGPMWDLPKNDEIGKLAADIYKAGGVVSAVCHGPVGLIPIKLENGEKLIKGKKLTCFTESEEKAVKLDSVVPFPLESRLKELGAGFDSKPDFMPNVVVDGRLVTGQNPASATGVADEVIKLLK